MKTEGTVSIRCLLLAAAWLALNPVSAQQFLRAPAASETDLVSGDRLTRTFKINPNAFLFDADDAIMTGKVVENKNIQERVRDYLKGARINFTETNGPRFFFNERTGILTVQGTIAQLEAVEIVLQALTTKPAQVAVEVRLLQTTSQVGNKRLKALLPQLEADEFVLPSALPLQSSQDSSPLLRSSVLTQKEFANLLRSAEQAEGIDTVTTPRAVTLSGRQARIVVEEPYETILDPPFHGTSRLKLNAE